MTEKRILFDATVTNLKKPGGGAFVTQGFLNAVLALYPDKVDVLQASEACIIDDKYETISVSRRSKLTQITDALVGRFHRSAKFIINYIRDNTDKYEYIFLNVGTLNGATIKIINNLGIKTVILHHNYEPEFNMGSKSILTLNGKTELIVKFWERIAYRNATINLFVTKQDLLKFENVYGKRANNFYLGSFELYPKNEIFIPDYKSKSFVITCALCDAQNVYSIRRFEKQYLKIFHKVLPDWKLDLMGRNPSEEIIGLSKKYSFIDVIANPININELCAQRSVYFCPMDAGGGRKIRIMDGLRNGQPIMCHEISARGYDSFFDKPYFIVYNDQISFEKGLKYLSSYVLSENFSRQYIQEDYYNEYSFENGINRLKKALESSNF